MNTFSSNGDETHIERLRLRDYEVRMGLEREIARLERIAKHSRLSLVTNGEAKLPSELHDLTARERQVLKCIAEGLSTKQTAVNLGIKFKTAACHRHRVMQKLNVHETTSLVHIAIRCGLVKV